eukprot:GEMP01078676.1.p1 GENE.GEMP01078676.1~~GEMP01078676.1.p1  ORF type:complete len:127 (+),score=15.52 GEMP01078676.1:392-772(+)
METPSLSKTLKSLLVHTQSVDCSSGDESVMVGTIVTSFSFHNGGCGTFLPIYFRIMNEVQNNKINQLPGVISGIVQQNQANTAYCDQGDPSVLYVVQPSVVVAQEASAPPVPAPGGNVVVGVPVFR